MRRSAGYFFTRDSFVFPPKPSKSGAPRVVFTKDSFILALKYLKPLRSAGGYLLGGPLYFLQTHKKKRSAGGFPLRETVVFPLNPGNTLHWRIFTRESCVFPSAPQKFALRGQVFASEPGGRTRTCRPAGL